MLMVGPSSMDLSINGSGPQGSCDHGDPLGCGGRSAMLVLTRSSPGFGFLVTVSW
jgi:hypothetical protein